jgi:hypothetical protein
MRPGQPLLTLPGVGPVSAATQVVAGMGLLIAGYHVLAHTLNWIGFRLPMWLVAAAVPVGVLMSILVDRLENRLPGPDERKERE